MSSRTLRILAAVVVGLVGLLLVLQWNERPDGDETDRLLFPDLRARVNAVDEITVVSGDGDPVVVARGEGGWSLPARDGYDADMSKVRGALLGLSDARIVETKTSNPDNYSQLGVAEPGPDSESVEIRLSGDDVAYGLILGNVAPGDSRFVRPSGEEQSYLVDQNPEIPEDVTSWLDPELFTIDADRVRSVLIEHADGETIRVEKDSPDAARHEVRDVPEGRELSFATVGNNLASLLSDFRLEDVRRAGSGDTEPQAVTTVETFDGVRVVARTWVEDDVRWTGIEAFEIPVAEQEDEVDADEDAEDAAAEAPPAADPAADEPSEGERDAATATSDADPEADAAAPDDAAQAAAARKPDPAEEVARINERVEGWQFRPTSYTGNLLVRRWDDILADPPEASDETDGGG